MKNLYPIIRYLLSIHLLNLTFSSIFRLLFILFHYEKTADSSIKLFIEAFGRGIQYDNLIASYVMSLPLFIWGISFLINKWSVKMVKCTNLYFIIINILLFMVSASDIRYFGYFSSHLNVAAFGWFKYGITTTDLILQDAANYIFMAIYFVAIIAFTILILRIGKVMKQSNPQYYPKYAPAKIGYKIMLTLLLFGLCFISMRGGFQRYPLRISNAFFSPNSFANQVPINPSFFLLKSYQYGKKKFMCANNLMDDKTALAKASAFLGVSLSADGDSFEKTLPAKGDAIQPNVVIVLMESMSGYNLARKHNGKFLTPYLNQLKDSSYYFDNFYSAGTHTNIGIVSTLYSIPAQFNKAMMEQVPIPEYGGMPKEFQKMGYQTLFFITGNPQYDSMNSFLRENNIEHIFSLYDYPTEKVANNFGVQDDYLFEFGVEKLNEMSKEDKPFFATFLTVSNHEPLVVPDRFKNSGANAHEDIIVFADNAIKEFMEKAQETEWFDNTIFVFLGDHGANVGGMQYDISLNYNHIPLMIYSKLFQNMPQKYSQFGGQIDVFPTVMGLMNQPFTNKTLGIDLLREERPCMFFTNDNQLACISSSNIYIRNLMTNQDYLFELGNEKRGNIFMEYQEHGNMLKNYALSMTVVGDLQMRQAQRLGDLPN